ncbi:asparagine synthase-related protein [Kitasatospora sp. NPDC052896]|uniref:asparagine synthase-related protein n=1 Tax=Kitasatospora sp. NPDC052896 TaxID=3364061 RepID=UPI0037C825B9
MTPLPAVLGFAVSVGADDHRLSAEPARRLAVRGGSATVDHAGHGLSWTGTAVTGTPRDPALSGQDGRRLLLAGELYNREELALALGDPALVTVPDSHLLLRLWERYGGAALRLLNGRYALLLTDGDRLVAATDHAASLPLHLAVVRHPGGRPFVRAATEAKALAGTDTPARRVPAGSALIVDLADPDPRPVPLATWTPPVSRRILPPHAAVAAVREQLDRAVRARLGDGTPPTVVLSGGIDSSAVTALAVAHCGTARTITLGTDLRDEFEAARLVVDHLGTEHEEITVDSASLLRDLAWTVWAAEITDPDVLEYLLPLVSLYRRLPGAPRRILTGYGADIPLGGMHRDTAALETLDQVLAADMATFDGLNELAPALSGVAGHWTTHPYWDREVLDLLVSLEPGVKRRDGTDKWVLRRAMAGTLPERTLGRRKLGIHEGSGTTSAWSRALRDAGVPEDRIHQAKAAEAAALYRRLVVEGAHPDDTDQDTGTGEHR